MHEKYIKPIKNFEITIEKKEEENKSLLDRIRKLLLV